MQRTGEQRGPSNVKPIALVTGGNRGIGRAAVLALAARGFDIAFSDLAETDDTARTRREAEARGARVGFAAGDIADLESHAAIVEAAYALAGRLDVLVNNAGVSVALRGDVLDVTPESFDRVLGVNLRGTFFLTQRAARRMLADAAPPYPRSIVTITSANAVIAAPDRAEYCYAKTALSMMVKILALRLGAAGIACYEIRPGIIRTGMTAVAAEKYDRLIAEGLTPVARWGEADDVGRVVAAMAAGELPFVTGDALHVDGGLHIHKL
jgi:NAD(P)-dependent dehydrogenase (short-subunit alcohol dehydrogenase family)